MNFYNPDTKCKDCGEEFDSWKDLDCPKCQNGVYQFKNGSETWEYHSKRNVFIKYLSNGKRKIIYSYSKWKYEYLMDRMKSIQK